MNKLAKRILIIYFCCIFFIPFVLGIIFSNSEESTGPNDYARITDVDYKAELVDDPYDGSKVVITEKLTYDVHAASRDNLFWELWRDLPEDYVDGLKVYYKVNYVKQIDDDGDEIEYSESPKLYWDDSDYTSRRYGPGKWYHSVGPYDEELANYECVFFYVNGLYREEVTFEIQYEMYNAALRYDDVSELYLSMYSEETIEHLESFEGQILIPDEDMPDDDNYVAHTYGTNSHTFDFSESDRKNPGYHTFSFSLDEDDLQFKKYNQYIEFSLLAFNEDAHIFTEYAPDNYYSDDVYLDEALEAIEDYDNLPEKAERNKKNLFTFCVIVSVIVIVHVIKRDKKIRKKHNLYEPTMQMDYFRDIPSDLDPHFAANLVFAKHKKNPDDGDGYSALLLNLVRKEYIELERIDGTKDWISDNINIKILYQPMPVTTLENQVTSASNSSALTNNVVGVTVGTTVLNSVTVANQVFQKAMPVQEQQLNNTEMTDAQPKVVEAYNIKGKKLEKLSVNEQTYFNSLVRYAIDNTISINDFQKKVSTDYDVTNKFVRDIEKSTIDIGISKGYFQKASYNSVKDGTISLASTYLVFAIMLIIVGNMIIINTRLDLAHGAFLILGITLIICSMYLKKIAHRYVLFTQFGEDEYAKWRALYNFLNSETLIKERTVVELPLWEKYLVYATAFGISDKVIKALEIQCPDVAASPMLSNTYYRSSSFRTSGRSFRIATRSAASVARGYGYGGGSYYGGGGRGGGGGGGGH